MNKSTYTLEKWAYIILGWGLVLYAVGWFLAQYNQITGHLPY